MDKDDSSWIIAHTNLNRLFLKSKLKVFFSSTFCRIILVIESIHSTVSFQELALKKVLMNSR
jgi:hypothetical protein